MVAVGGDMLRRSSEILQKLQVRRVFGFLQQVIFKTNYEVKVRELWKRIVLQVLL